MITAQLVDAHLARATSAHPRPTTDVASGNLKALNGDRRSPDPHQPPPRNGPPSSSSTRATAPIDSSDKERYVAYLETLKVQLRKYAERR